MIRARGRDGSILELEHELVGAHQGWNILAGCAALEFLGVSPAELRRAAASFRGVKRRAELRGEVAGIRVYDDFAHHPTAIRGTLEGFRELYPHRRIWAVLEPRSNTMRRRVFQTDLAASFDAADGVWLREVPNPEKVPAGERLDVGRLARDLVAKGIAARSFPDAGAILADLLPGLAEGDLVVVLSNGGFEGIHERILQGLAGHDGEAR
jgi:UDP-N-acetylmuramate: L-alanyl-gamma-D-glutamyl-meso-diaminopimelate ligase